MLTAKRLKELMQQDAMIYAIIFHNDTNKVTAHIECIDFSRYKLKYFDSFPVLSEDYLEFGWKVAPDSNNWVAYISKYSEPILPDSAFEKFEEAEKALVKIKDGIKE